MEKCLDEVNAIQRQLGMRVNEETEQKEREVSFGLFWFDLVAAIVVDQGPPKLENDVSLCPHFSINDFATTSSSLLFCRVLHAVNGNGLEGSGGRRQVLEGAKELDRSLDSQVACSGGRGGVDAVRLDRTCEPWHAGLGYLGIGDCVPLLRWCVIVWQA